MLVAAFISVLLPASIQARTTDLAAPTLTASCSPGGGCDGWFTTNVNISFVWTVPAGETFWSEDGCNGFSVTSENQASPVA